MARKPGSLGRALRINYETIYGLPNTVDLGQQRYFWVDVATHHTRIKHNCQPST
jgi:hypothetical protein